MQKWELPLHMWAFRYAGPSHSPPYAIPSTLSAPSHTTLHWVHIPPVPLLTCSLPPLPLLTPGLFSHLFPINSCRLFRLSFPHRLYIYSLQTGNSFCYTHCSNESSVHSFLRINYTRHRSFSYFLFPLIQCDKLSSSFLKTIKASIVHFATFTLLNKILILFLIFVKIRRGIL